MRNYVRTCVVAGLTALAMPAFAASPEPVQQHNSNAVWFENWIGLSNATMKVLTPQGDLIEVFAASGTPVFRLGGDAVADGVYRYELVAASDEMIEIRNPVDNGRGDAARNTMNKPFSMNGTFVVSRNVIITPEDIKE